uniref:Uncharacterized protein MANES_01G120200 n=1 Tax=Rhizophora mucronata TaxID=61149 RepID=A0A2P2IVD1_RHIMU
MIISLSHSQSLVRTPDLSGAKYLKQLILEGCTKLCEIDKPIGPVENLNLLNLKDCKNLQNLLSCVYSLQMIINLSGCSKLEYKLEEFGNLCCLEEIDVSQTTIRQSPNFCFKF